MAPSFKCMSAMCPGATPAWTSVARLVTSCLMLAAGAIEPSADATTRVAETSTCTEQHDYKAPVPFYFAIIMLTLLVVSIAWRMRHFNFKGTVNSKGRDGITTSKPEQTDEVQ